MCEAVQSVVYYQENLVKIFRQMVRITDAADTIKKILWVCVRVCVDIKTAAEAQTKAEGRLNLLGSISAR